MEKPKKGCHVIMPRSGIGILVLILSTLQTFYLKSNLFDEMIY
jgi:hypothetical protein